MKLNLIICCFLFFLLGCTSNNEKKDTLRNATIKKENLTHTLKVVGSKSFELDSMTSPRTACIQLVEAEKGKRLYYQNTNDNSIRVFDFETGKQVEKISYDREGENGVVLEAFHYHNDDSIFVYSRNKKAFLTDKEGKVKVSVKIGGKVYLDILTSNNQMVWNENKLFLIGTNFMNNYSPFISVSFDTQNIDSVATFKVSEDYKNGGWGMSPFGMFRSCYNYSTQNWIVSFPMDNFLYITDLKGNTKKVSAASNEFDSIIPPYQTANEGYQAEDATEKYFLSPSYQQVYQNPYTNYIFRYVNYAISKEDIASQDPIRSVTSEGAYIVLDANYNKVAEYRMPYNQYLGRVFFTSEGVYVAKVDTENEDKLTFDIFNVVEIEK